MRKPFFILFFFCLLSCSNEAIYNPKPRAFPKIEYPERIQKSRHIEGCNFTFDFPDYGIYEKDEEFFGTKTINDCWFNLNLPVFKSKIHLSYFDIKSMSGLEGHIKDAFKLSSKHNVKANYIDEIPFKKPNGISGVIFDIEGNVASPYQFYLTDSSEHFLRGALYMEGQVRPDSCKPILEFIKTDIAKMINSFEWLD